MKSTLRVAGIPLILFLISLLLAPSVAMAQVQPLDFPGATATFVYDINDFGQIVGRFFDADGFAHGFLYDGGTYTAINYPGADWTEAWGINQQGDIVGFYGYKTDNLIHGFLRTAGGTFNSIDRQGRWNTMPEDINSSGVIVGCMHNPGSMHGWVMKDGTFASVSPADVQPAGSTMYTGVNDLGTIIGWYWTPKGNRSFVLIGTERTDFQYPGAGNTQAWGLNSDGDVVGWYGPAASSRGFLLREGQFTPVHVTDATWTRAFGINADGDIVGAYRDGTGFHGFLLTAE